VSTLGIPCQEVDNNQETFHKVIEKIRQVKPDIVITHSGVCKHRDHRATSELVWESCWKSSENILEDLGPPHSVGLVLECEILDSFENPDYIVDITDHYDTKCAAMAIYLSQGGIIPGVEQYLDGITLVRGYIIGPGRRAEAFKRLGKLPHRL
jgi:LmbE family N-acetylglucosaminyl deacetylase